MNFRIPFHAADRRTIPDFAREHVQLPASITKHGTFDISTSRQLLAPFASLQSDHVREVVVRAPVRGAKSLIPDIWLPWTVENDPGPFLWLMQTDAVAKDHAETRAMPVLEMCLPIRKWLPGREGGDRHKKRSQAIMFNNGMPFWIRGPSIGNLQSKGIRYLVCDEVWLWETGLLAEAKGRLGDYEEMQTSKLLVLSQAGIEDDDFDQECQRGHGAEWHVHCLKCNHFQRPRWDDSRPDGSRWGMRFALEKDTHGDYSVRKAVESRRYECEKCGHPHTDYGRTRVAWNTTGDYVAKDEGNYKIHSYHYSGLITRDWDSLVEEYVRAINARNRGVAEPIIQFWQKRMAEPKSEGSAFEMTKAMTVVAYDAKGKWSEETHRFMTIDRQEEDVFWWSVRAWTPHGKSRRLGFGKAFSAGECEVLRKDHDVPPNYTFLDSGFFPKGDNGVYSICVKFGWIAFKGAEESYFIHKTKAGAVRRSYSAATRGDPESGHADSGKRFATLIRFAATVMKDRVNRLIDRQLWEEPTREDSEIELAYRKQMSSEFKRRKKDRFTGREQLIYVCPSGDNHAFDCASMQAAAATICKLIPDQDVMEGTAGQATQ